MLLLLFVHLIIKFFSLVKDLHKFTEDFVTVQSLENVLLVLELILWLLGLLCSLLFLD